MRREKPGRTLQTTALVHEAYLRLLKGASLSFESRAHFLGIAARAMREILIERARARAVASKRGGAAGAPHPRRPDVAPGTPRRLQSTSSRSTRPSQRLARLDERHARVVELRYLGGLSVDETAAALDLSPCHRQARVDARAGVAVPRAGGNGFAGGFPSRRVG